MRLIFFFNLLYNNKNYEVLFRSLKKKENVWNIFEKIDLLYM